jgi:uncharacterized membrane protein YraQ (UPF0718 family)
MNELLHNIAASTLSIIIESGFWIVLSLIVAGLIHEFINPEKIRHLMNRSGPGGILAALGLGAVLPTCSCGVIPLAVSFYLNRIRLAAVMTFAAATPVINPAAVVLSYAMLGPELTIAYVIFGLTAPVLTGLAAERWGKPEMTPVAEELNSCCRTSCCESSENSASTQAASTQAATNQALPTTSNRLWLSMRWGFTELGPTLGLYIGFGVLLAGIITAAVPTDWIFNYLGESAPFLSLLLVALFGASIYVCAVAHIPLVAALLATGAAPGIAIVFLVTGAASNLPELIALQRVMGTRTVAIYVSSLIGLSLIAGWLVNLWLLPGYTAISNPEQSLEWATLGENLNPVIPETLSIICAAILIILMTWGLVRWLGKMLPVTRVLSYLHR